VLRRTEGASVATGYLGEKEVTLMRRTLLVLSVAALMAEMMVAMAAPAFAANLHGTAQGETASEGKAESTGYGSFGKGTGGFIECSGVFNQSGGESINGLTPAHNKRCA